MGRARSLWSKPTPLLESQKAPLTTTSHASSQYRTTLRANEELQLVVIVFQQAQGLIQKTYLIDRPECIALPKAHIAHLRVGAARLLRCCLWGVLLQAIQRRKIDWPDGYGTSLRVSTVCSGAKPLKKRQKDPLREDRIHNEAVADANGPEEQIMGWHCYKIRFPFQGQCIASRVISALRKGETVEVLRMAPEDACSSEMLVLIRWKDRFLAVPLSELLGINVERLDCSVGWSRVRLGVFQPTPEITLISPSARHRAAGLRFSIPRSLLGE